MKHVVLLFLVGVLVACSSAPVPPTRRTDWFVNFNFMADGDVFERCYDLTGFPAKQACITSSVSTGKADVYMPMPDTPNDTHWQCLLGHELAHLPYGGYHE